jgi:hypothetical protein
MDPNFIHMDWERTFEALMLVAVVAIIVERSLSILFENRIYIEHFHRDGMKELIALAASIAVCAAWKLDAIGMILLSETTTMPGYVVTAGLVAGGSKGSVKLFQEYFALGSTAHKMRHSIQAAKAAEEAQRASGEVQDDAISKATAQIKKASVDAAFRRTMIAAETARAKGLPVPIKAVEAAENALKDAEAAIAAKK